MGNKAEVEGIDGMLEAYRSLFQRGLIMSSPTVLSDVIRVAASRAERNLVQAMENGGQSYAFLLILTHGCDSNIQRTKEVLIQASRAPISVIMVGIGDNDFRPMRYLDDFHKKEGVRDVCNFIEYDEYKSKDISELRQAVLDEIPAQMTTYFKARNIMPAKVQPLEEEM